MWKFCCRVLVAALLFPVAPAVAQWMHMAGEDDPFAGGAQQIAGGVADTGEMVMFRCTTGSDLAMLFVSIEKPPEDAAILAMLAASKATLLVIVDNDPVVVLPAVIDTTPDRQRLRYVSSSPLVESITARAAAAKRRVAVAVEINGKRVYSTAVAARGSGRELGKLTRACRLGS